MSDRYRMVDELSDGVLIAMRGAPINVLFVMIVLRLRGHVAVEVNELVASSGLSKPTVISALGKLETFHLAANNGNRYGAWRLAEGILQSPLMQYIAGELPPTGSNPENAQKIFTSPSQPAPEIIDGEVKKFFTSPAEDPGSKKFLPQNESEVKNFYLPGDVNVLKESSLINDSEEIERRRLKTAEAKAALEATGLEPAKVEEFLAGFSPERLILACDVYDWGRHTCKPKSDEYYAIGRGWLIGFITKGWRTPSPYIPQAERCPSCYRRLNNHAYDCPVFAPPDPDADPLEEPGTDFRSDDAGDPSGRGNYVPGCAPSGPERPSPPVVDAIWSTLLGQLKAQLSPEDFERARRLVPVPPANDQVFCLAAPDADLRSWSARCLTSRVKQLLAGQLGRELFVEFVLLSAPLQ